MYREAFVKLVAPAAQALQRKSGIFASVKIAQAIQETGWGKHLPIDKYTGKESHNIFGIKGTGPAGSVLCDTWEVQDGQWVRVEAYFRAYNNVQESLEDHSGLLMTAPRYRPVREAKTPEDQCRQLQATGYATDTNYAGQLIKIIHNNDLKRFDLVDEDTKRILYEVRPGDTLSRIAERYMGSASRWKELYQANRAVVGTNPDLIYPGQVLTVPGGYQERTDTVSRSQTTQTYTVVSGDTLSSIAARYLGSASRWKELYQANRDRVADPDRIYPGQVLRLPPR